MKKEFTSEERFEIARALEYLSVSLELDVRENLREKDETDSYMLALEYAMYIVCPDYDKRLEDIFDEAMVEYEKTHGDGRMIYLDSAAMMRPLDVAIKAYHDAPSGNPFSENHTGQDARTALENARYTISKCLDCEPNEIYFTSTATEAAAMVMNCLRDNGYTITSSNIERHDILENAKGYAQTSKIAWLRMLANNETGEILKPPHRILEDLWICDATAAVGHIPVSFKKLGCDYLIADAIEFGGARGAAILIARTGAPLSPVIRGEGQEHGRRSGIINVSAICAMAEALEWQVEHMDENVQKIGILRAMMFKMLSEIPGHKWNTPFKTPCVAHILNISFDGVDSQELSTILSHNGIMVSADPACSNDLNERVHTIMAMYNDEEKVRSAIRISFSAKNTPDEIVEAGQKIKDAVAHLRSLA